MERNVLNKFARQINILYRQFSSKPKPIVVLDEQLRNALISEELKPKKHYGVNRLPSVELPDNIKNNIRAAIGDTPLKSLIEDAEDFSNYLWSRHAPAESGKIIEVSSICREHIIKEMEEKNKALENTSDEETNLGEEKEPKPPIGQRETEEMIKKLDRKLKKMVQEKVYHWEAVNYNKYAGLKYLVKRSAAEYAVLVNIFNEITKREPNFQPESLFDFGSGVGTVSWAVLKNFKQSLKEIYSVDVSGEMNDLARFVLTGSETASPPVPRYFQRQFLPSQPVPYDLVVSSYSLFELPSMKSRLQTVLNLWRRTSRFLILIEAGSNAGFHILEEARAFILDQKDGDLVGHVFAPCPHDAACPRYATDHTPCNFLASHFKLSFLQRQDASREMYSYVVFRKGPRPAEEKSWPRIVRPPIVKAKQAICRMCCVDGNLQEIIFTAKRFDKLTYRCSKHCNWGDRLPVEIFKPEIEPESVETLPNEQSDKKE